MDFIICDALCGAGKTVASINMINEDKASKFLFITPYLTEVNRIESACQIQSFMAPQRSWSKTKGEMFRELITEGINIASTHALFSTLNEEDKRAISEQGYTLILDEVLDMFDMIDLADSDIKLLEDSNNIKCNDNGEIEWVNESYDFGRFSDIHKASESHTLVRYPKGFYFWQIPMDIFTCFKRVIVLTYMFEYQPLRYFLQVHNIPYSFIGVKPSGGTYRFCPISEMDRRRDYRSLIEIVTRNKYNAIGADNYTLSSGWYKREAKKGNNGKLPFLKKQIRNVMSYWLEAKADDIMWTTYIAHRGRLRGKGYITNFVPFNMRATNDFATKHCLAYCINLYMQPWIKNYLMKIGATNVNEDMYALSLLIQWIFRSAIRKGEKVRIYIPSARMRYLLSEWIENLYKGEDLKEIRYVS